MKQAVSVLMLVFLFLHSLRAENWNEIADSLKLKLSSEQTDSGKIVLNLKLCDVVLRNQPDKAFEYATKAKIIAEGIGDTSLIIRSILKQCDFYSLIGEHNTSIELAYNALNIAGNNYRLLSLCHNRIATVHSDVGNLQETLEHNKKALLCSRLYGDSASIMVDFHNIGGSYIMLKMYDSALYYLRITNKYEIVHTGRPDPYSLSNIGNIFLETEQYDSALYYHLLAYKYDQLDDQKYLMAIDQQFIANTLFKMNRMWEAKEYALKSIAIANELKAYDLTIDSYEILYKIYSETGNYKSAFDYALLYNEAKDTLLENSKQSLILGLEMKHKVKEQEAKMQLLEKQKTLYVVLTFVSVLFIFSMIVIISLVYRRQRIYRELTHQLQSANDSKERLLSVISHDLRSSVGTLRTAAKVISEGITNVDESRNLLESFFPVADATYDLLENLLIWAKYSKKNIEPEFTLVNLKDIINKAVEHTQHLATSKTITIINKTPDQLIKVDKNMILSVVRNILNNAIKFSHPKGEVVIESKNTDENLVVSFTDNGIGMDNNQLRHIFENPEENQTPGTMGERGSGLGIMICKTFLNSHGGDIWAESSFGKGTTFYFSLPYQL